MSRRGRSRLGLAGLACMLAACATPPLAPGEAPWTSGRLSVHVAATATDAAQGLSAAFELRGNGDAGELHLDSPLGTRMASARWAPGLALLSTSKGDRRFDTLDDLSRQVLGQPVPLAALPAWIAGRPWSGAPSTASGSGFEQLGWHVQLARIAEGWIEARRDDPPAVVVRVHVDANP